MKPRASNGAAESLPAALRARRSTGSIAAGSEAQPVESVLAPLDRLGESSRRFLSKSVFHFEHCGRGWSLPRYLFAGPPAGDEPLRIGLFAGLHGDEPEGTGALVEFLGQLQAQPDPAEGYRLLVYPVCNPTGLADGTRHSRSGADLNREFWTGSRQPEVQHLEAELKAHAFHGIIALHTDDTSEGIYGYVRGATLTEHLLNPAIEAAATLLPRNDAAIIDGFPAQGGIIRDCFPGVLTAPPGVQPRPFEIILESPQAAPEPLKERALVLALQTILAEYRQLIAYAANL